MNYVEWRDDIFSKESGSDPVMVELLEESYRLSNETVLDYIDAALVDSEIHGLFTKEQIGIGLQIIYSNTCSDIPFCYVQAGCEERRINAIKKLKYLYVNYFEKYCHAPVNRIGYDLDDGQIGYLCYMFWDIFVLYPDNASKGMVDAAIGVMREALESNNDNCIVSLLHGLGHWSIYTPVASEVIEEWLKNPSTNNKNVIEYAERAKNDNIQ